MPGEVTRFCGIDITRTTNEIIFSQETYVQELLKKFGMENCKPSKTPITEALVPSESKMQDPKVANKYPYRELLGSLMFLMTQTRPDIAYAVGMLSRFGNNYTEEHWIAAKRVLRYLKATANYCLSSKLNRESGKATIDLFSDSDWATGTDRKSVSGIVIVLDFGV
jgi:hypothetical protein